MEQIIKLFENELVVVVNKPAGIVVNRSETVQVKTVQDWMEENFPELFRQKNDQIASDEAAWLFRERSGLVHRLDKNTSGVLLLAKSPNALIDLMEQFKNRQVSKSYVALVHGRLEPTMGKINLPLGRIPKNRTKFGVVVGGKMSLTEYEVIKNFRVNLPKYQDGFCLVNLYPLTGRTHQLRVVLRHLGRPIVGDRAYVGRKRYKEDIKWCGRQFLHASTLRFRDPETRKMVEVIAELQSDLNLALKWLNKYEI